MIVLFVLFANFSNDIMFYHCQHYLFSDKNMTNGAERLIQQFGGQVERTQLPCSSHNNEGDDFSKKELNIIGKVSWRAK